MTNLTFADLSMGKIPVSRLFDDIYFSTVDGVAESLYHFLDGNNLAPRFSQLVRQQSPKPFTLAETGFGTGLNFLLTAKLWFEITDKQGISPAKLHYISSEKHPIKPKQLRNIYQQNQWLDSTAESILANYPQTPRSGAYHITIRQGNSDIQLTLLLGDAYQQFSHYEFCADAWFLDGFAPSKNPDLWTDELFSLMAKRSHRGSTFATFTAASKVRKGLQLAGFSVEKAKGFGKKRERLLGHF